MNFLSVDPGRLRNMLKVMPGSRRVLLFFLFTLVVWIAFFYFQSNIDEVEGRFELRQDRFMDFLQLVQDYRVLSGVPSEGTDTEVEGGAVQIISDLLGRLEIRDNLVQMSMTGSGTTLQLRDLYLEDMANLVENLEKSGTVIDSAQIRALQTKEGRVFDLSLIVVSGE